MRCFTERRVRCSSSDRGTYTTGGLSKSYFPCYHNDHGGYGLLAAITLELNWAGEIHPGTLSYDLHRARCHGPND